MDRLTVPSRRLLVLLATGCAIALAMWVASCGRTGTTCVESSLKEYEVFPHGKFCSIPGEELSEGLYVDADGNVLTEEEFADSLWAYLLSQEQADNWVERERSSIRTGMGPTGVRELPINGGDSHERSLLF